MTHQTRRGSTINIFVYTKISVTPALAPLAPFQDTLASGEEELVSLKGRPLSPSSAQIRLVECLTLGGLILRNALSNVDFQGPV